MRGLGQRGIASPGECMTAAASLRIGQSWLQPFLSIAERRLLALQQQADPKRHSKGEGCLPASEVATIFTALVKLLDSGTLRLVVSQSVIYRHRPLGNASVTKDLTGLYTKFVCCHRDYRCRRTLACARLSEFRSNCGQLADTVLTKFVHRVSFGISITLGLALWLASGSTRRDEPLVSALIRVGRNAQPSRPSDDAFQRSSGNEVSTSESRAHSTQRFQPRSSPN